ncbi:unknown protein [Seminavis robusta]|uniref:Uncharacterized protein n=1 Tax=Seminavis robusta TaxID=568900 RepID=A0A9N8DVN2_9STRA|nr:unknown protein [Seminavis robusta]|eukprot:Sro407_g136510.1 n/a (186) ;mRNA; r:1952-2509
MPPKKKPDWKTSLAKEYLYDLVADGQIPDGNSLEEVDAREIYDQYCQGRPEFGPYPFDNKFEANLLRIRNKVAEKDDRSAIGAVALAHDRLIFPKPTEDVWGEPVWQDSVAQQLLIEDIDDNKHIELLPRFLYATRPEYQVYALDRFRNRIYQEVKKMKREAYMLEKSEKKREKQMEKLAKYNLA